MIRRLCRVCGSEMTKELTPDGPRFFCKACDGHTDFDEYDCEPFCPDCDGEIEVCSKCSVGYFCNKCGALVSRKKIVWKDTSK